MTDLSRPALRALTGHVLRWPSDADDPAYPAALMWQRHLVDVLIRRLRAERVRLEKLLAMGGER